MYTEILALEMGEKNLKNRLDVGAMTRKEMAGFESGVCLRRA